MKVNGTIASCSFLYDGGVPVMKPNFQLKLF